TPPPTAIYTLSLQRRSSDLAHEYLQKLALEYTDGLFVHPIVGWKKAGDFSQRAQFETYEALFERYYPRERVLLGGFYCQVRYARSEEHTSELQSRFDLVCRL